MSRRVRLSVRASRDVERLIEFLFEVSPMAARRARGILSGALDSLQDFPARSRPVSEHHPNLREMPVKFGRYGYAIRYQIRRDEVFVTGIFHTLESR